MTARAKTPVDLVAILEAKEAAALEVGRKVQDLVLAVDRMLEADSRYYTSVERQRSQRDQIRAVAQ